MDISVKNINQASLFLRVGLAWAFMYAAFAQTTSPESWLFYYPDFLQEIAKEQWFQLAGGIGEFIFGLWILSGFRVFYSSVIAALILSSIVIFNLDTLYILFRDIGLIFAAFALAILHYPKPLER